MGDLSKTTTVPLFMQRRSTDEYRPRHYSDADRRVLRRIAAGATQTSERTGSVARALIESRRGTAIGLRSTERRMGRAVLRCPGRSDHRRELGRTSLLRSRGRHRRADALLRAGVTGRRQPRPRRALPTAHARLVARRRRRAERRRCSRHGRLCQEGVPRDRDGSRSADVRSGVARGRTRRSAGRGAGAEERGDGGRPHAHRQPRRHRTLAQPRRRHREQGRGDRGDGAVARGRSTLSAGRSTPRAR